MTERQVVDAARATISGYRNGAHLERDNNLGYARYTYKPKNTDVYRILVREDVQTQVNGIWYPAVVYQNVNSGNVYVRTDKDFRVKYRVFRTLQDAATWGKDF